MGPLDPHASQVPHDSLEALEAELERRRARARGGDLRRAGDRRGRRAPAAPGLRRGRRGAVRARRRAVRRRRGDRRLRPAGHVVRRRPLRRAAGHDLLRQGRDERLPAARRRGRLRPRGRAVLGARRARCSATARRTAPTRRAARRRMANLDILEREGLLDRGRELEDEIAARAARRSRGHELVGEVRAGHRRARARWPSSPTRWPTTRTSPPGSSRSARPRGARPPARRRAWRSRRRSIVTREEVEHAAA